jgi:hypothetical protein
VKVVAAPAMSSSSNDLGFDFGSLSQYMESAPSTPKPKTDKEESKAAAQAAAKAKKEAEAAKKEAAKKEAETKKAAAKAAAEQAKAERAAAKADKKPIASKPAKPAKREVTKNKPSFTKSKGGAEFNPFAGAYRPAASEKTSLPGKKVDVDAIIDRQDAKADATLAKANVETGDFLNISPEAGFGIAATLAFVYETENKKFEEKRKAAMNAPKSTPSKPVGSGGESTTEGWFSGFLSSLVKDGAKTTVKKTTQPAAQKSDPAKNSTQAQQWIDKWSTSSSADPSKDAQKWIDKWSSSKPAAPKAEAPKAEAPKAEAPKAPKSDPAKNAKEAQAWIDKWSSSVKTTAKTTAKTTTTTTTTTTTATTATTATKATTSDNLTADQRAAAEEWIKKWRADGRPTDESRFGDAKKWLKEHNFEE